MKYSMSYIAIILLLLGCKKPYDPPEINEATSFLVVEGVINGNPASSTIISLSRLRNLSDTSYNQPEFNAQITIEEEGGSLFPLQDKGNGDYSSDVLTLKASKRYRLLVNTTDGKKYASDFTPVLQTPPIDTLTWEQNSDVTLYVSTHDLLNQTHYYRWDYIETWEYHSFYNSIVKYIPDTVVYDTNNSTHICWQTGHSTDISLGNTTALSSDVIAHARIGTIPHNSQKCSERYSALVKQYALSQEAYEYWLVLQKLSEEAGTLFDVQPSQLQGNIHSLSGNEPVIGYISASTIPEKRMFIDHSSLTDWKEFDGNYCDIRGVAANTPDITHYLFSDGYYAPYYFSGMGYVTYTWKSCVDCRTQGGTTVKPSFW